MTHTQGAAKAHSRPSSVLGWRVRFGAIAMVLLCSIAWAVVLLLSGIRLGANLFDVFAVLIAAFVLSALSYVVLAVLAILWRSWRCELIVLPAIAVILTFLPQSLAPLVSPARDDAVARHLSEALESETCPTDAPFMNVEECDWSAQPRRVKLGGSFLMTEEYLTQLGPDGEESGIDFVPPTQPKAGSASATLAKAGGSCNSSGRSSLTSARNSTKLD